jgi:hypothetical protein
MTIRIQIIASEIEYSKHLMYNSTESKRQVCNTVHNAILEWSVDAKHVRNWIDWALEFLPVQSESWSEETKILSRILNGDPLEIQSVSEDGLKNRNIVFKPLFKI